MNQMIIWFSVWVGLAHIMLWSLNRRLKKVEKETAKINMDISKLSDAFSKFAGDFSTFKGDLTTFLGTLKPEDPAVQATIDGFTAKLGEMDTDVQGMDASLKPAV